MAGFDLLCTAFISFCDNNLLQALQVPGTLVPATSSGPASVAAVLAFARIFAFVLLRTSRPSVAIQATLAASVLPSSSAACLKARCCPCRPC